MRLRGYHGSEAATGALRLWTNDLTVGPPCQGRLKHQDGPKYPLKATTGRRAAFYLRSVSQHSSSLSFPKGYEQLRTLNLSTIGRSTGKKHEVIVGFFAGGSRIFISAGQPKRDWIETSPGR